MGSSRALSGIQGVPVAEGVRFRIGTATVCAVRTESRDIAVHVRQQSHFLRRTLGRIPLLRGALRPLWALNDLLGGLNDSAALEPQRAIRGKRISKRFAELFRTHPQTLAAFGSALLLPIIVACTMLGMPMLVEWLLGMVPDLPRALVNGICCMFRMLGVVLCTFMTARLRVINRLCMYRGAMGKVLNAYEAYGEEVTHEEALLSSRLTDRSDGAFVLAAAMLSIAAYAFVRPGTPLYGVGGRIAIFFAICAVLNEFILPVENARQGTTLSELRAPLHLLQQLFTIEPHNQMIEVAVCAFHTARDNDLTRNRRSAEGA